MSEIVSSTRRGVRRPGVVAWLRLARAFQKLNRAATESLRAWDLSVAQFDVLAQLAHREGITQQELADHLLVTKGNVCQLLDRMERDDLVYRRQQGRANLLYLTPKGRELASQVVPAHEDFMDEAMSGLSGEEQRQLSALLRKLDSTLE